jgi:hypothetical protein
MNQSDFERLKTVLRAEQVAAPFSVLGEIAAAYAHAEAHGDRGGRMRARDLIIRCIERADAFAEQEQLLDTLIARAGLFPYIEDPERLELIDRLVYEAHKPLSDPGDRQLVFHGAQAEVYARLMDGESVVLTAPTSFGKSVIIDALIVSGRFDNIVVIVPTIALIDETRRRLTRAVTSHKVITHGSQARAERNVFVMTQERILEMRDYPPIDLLVVDEFYKLNLSQEGERSVLLNQAVYRVLRNARQFYLLGPNVGELAVLPRRFKFINIPSEDITVAVDINRVDAGDDKHDALANLVVTDLDAQTLVYCSNPGRATEVAQTIATALTQNDSAIIGDHAAADWVAKTYHPGWTLVEALRHGVGIHHGRIPRALAHWMVTAFNDGTLRYLVCTQTLIEGVNTSAKHVVIFDGIRNKTALDLFTFRNIQGRSGRMFRHFVGRVWLFNDEPSGELLDVDIPVLTQPDDTPEELLLEVDDDDLTPESRERLSPYLTQDLVSIEALKASAGVPLEAQLNLARVLHEEPRWAQRLTWSNPLYPKRAEISPLLKLLFEHFAPAQPWRRWGAGSPRQLGLLISRLHDGYQPDRLISDQFNFFALTYFSE